MKKRFLLFAAFVAIIFSSCHRENKKEEETRIAPTVPPLEEVVMYEVFVHNFTAEGTFNAMLPHLDRLRDMGVNVLWLMPIQPIGKENKKGTFGSPYAIQNYTEVNPDLGTKADFKRLVDSAHAKGMYIIIDEVANHTAWDSPWVKDHPDWYTHDSVTGKIIPPVPDWSDVADLNFGNMELRKEIIRSMKYWIDSFNIDGYRCDAAGMVPNDFWKSCISILRQSRPLIMLAESEAPEMYDNGFDMTYGWEMYHQLIKVWNGKAIAASIDSVLQKEHARFPGNYRPIRFVTDHDENSWDDVPQVKFVNMDGVKAAFVTMMTMPGTPFMYQGQEVGYPTKINLFEKYTIDWAADPDLQQWYAKLLNFYNHSEVLKEGTITFRLNASETETMIYQRKILGQDPLWIIVNPKNEVVPVLLPEELHGKLLDVISNEGIITEEIGNIKPYLRLRPFEYHIFKVE